MAKQPFDRKPTAEGLGVPAPPVGWVDEAQEVDLLGALQGSLNRARGSDRAAGLRAAAAAVGRLDEKAVRHQVGVVSPRPYPGGKDGWLVGECVCGFSTPPVPRIDEALGKLFRHISKATGRPFTVVKAEQRRLEMRAELEARHAGEREELRAAYAAEYLAEFGEVPDELLPPATGSTSGPIIRPSDGAVPPHEQFISGQVGYGKTNARAAADRERRARAERDLQKSFGPNAVGFGDLQFDFNPLTGDVRVTSSTGVLQVEPISPGVAWLRSSRREGTPGVTS